MQDWRVVGIICGRSTAWSVVWVCVVSRNAEQMLLEEHRNFFFDLLLALSLSVSW
jgi:hypothetical protein